MRGRDHCARLGLALWNRRSLVEDGLAASAHNFTPVRSVYTWQGRVHERSEGRASLHASRGRVADIVARAKREHPYEVPGISARLIIDGNWPELVGRIRKLSPTGRKVSAWTMRNL